MNYLIKTHRFGVNYKGLHFFVLNRGANTGKVLKSECPNCWVIIPDTADCQDRLKTIIRSMHLSGVLRQQLIGSVILFMRLKDFRKLLDIYIRMIGNQKSFDRQLIQISKVTELMEQYEAVRIKAKLALQRLHIELLRGD